MPIKKFLYTIDVKKVLEDNNIFLEADNKNIIQKDNRPYYVSVPLTSKHSAFIPIRTNLRHNFGYITKRHNRGKSGLDYTKSLIIEKNKLSSYLVKESGISLSEAKVIQSDQSIIHKNYQKFIFETFIPVFERDNKHRTPIEKRLVSFSSLQYFEKTLLQVKQERRDESMPRKNEDKEQWKQELLQKAETQLEEMSDSESFKKYLNTLAKFPNYSVNNVLLIQAQNPQATLVSGYKDWQKKFNRHVNKGAKALYITAPIIKTLNEEEKKKYNTTEDKAIVAYRYVPVFDIANTTGEPVLTAHDFISNEYTTEQTEIFCTDKLDKVSEYINKEYGISIHIKALDKNIGGYYRPKEHTIALNSLNSKTEQLKTLFHEFAHSQLHNTKALKELDEPLTRAHKEAQAESVAYLSMQTMGIDTSGYSVGYISTWAQDKDLMKQSLQEIKKVFNQTLEVIEKTPVQEQEQEIVSSQKQSPKQNNPIIELKNIQKIFDDRNNELAVSDPLFVAKMELYKDNMQQAIQVTHHCKTDTYDFTNLTTKEKLQIDEINQSQLHKEIKKVLAELEKEPEKQIESHQFKEESEQSNEQEDKQEPPQHKPFTPKL
ncbi:ImmA/IrrE family metallo-endopeptidase [Enterococcus faecalis]|uniref:ArdC-like ssDNA-binding domain-containing protein n=1 Tax=Lactobacillales TaxID=186826 RepID=UPI001143AE61|nr:ImmA/IrrE family metallo-endopeptidase [Enterococcus faecalis]NSP54864.1 ImmA/IrrE family metallo-endopeptidase [Enterococcus faecalis]NSQ56224.1 ImmA/IrrE family metallo-endopeptidase [Enterococcus faecalis]NSW25931.1 ImmA/IrrE family metallo-endopeptidase [Enterococcus faecalis]NSW34256.1 ImmA/IrrE family metallo-endopeptidase [Enterococcus faecalis]TQB49757.1 ImmA/IrrE family metallo-endopeptidase [Enterococcus faecalis]